MPRIIRNWLRKRRHKASLKSAAHVRAALTRKQKRSLETWAHIQALRKSMEAA